MGVHLTLFEGTGQPYTLYCSSSSPRCHGGRSSVTVCTIEGWRWEEGGRKKREGGRKGRDGVGAACGVAVTPHDLLCPILLSELGPGSAPRPHLSFASRSLEERGGRAQLCFPEFPTIPAVPLAADPSFRLSFTPQNSVLRAPLGKQHPWAVPTPKL